MGRQLRRFSVRLGLVASALSAGTFLYHRWGLRHGSATMSVTLPAEWAALPPTERRRRHCAALGSTLPPINGSAASETSKPYDVLVVGGGVTGLYAAVDAAQRGLTVALVEAADFGAGSTSTRPVLTPGAFPYVQRAIRQRDSRWLRRAYHTLEDATIWSNTAPHCMELSAAAPSSPQQQEEPPVAVNRARTLIPALHTAELLELSVTAWISTALSLLCGPLRPCAPLKASSAVNRELPRFVDIDSTSATGDSADGGGGGAAACGGVVVHDFLLDGSKAAVFLARTAEALGVTVLSYAELLGLCYEAASVYAVDGDGTSPSPFVVATVRVDEGGQPRFVNLRTRGVINCTGADVDTVKEFVPHNSLDAVPAAFDRFHVYSYLVAPRSALYRAGGPRASATATQSSDEREAGKRNTGSSSFANAERGGRKASAAGGDPPDASLRDRGDPEPFRWLAKPGAALQVASTKYSFSTMLVTPWFDDTVLLGPSITPISQTPRKHNSWLSSGGPFSCGTSQDVSTRASTFLRATTGGFQAQKEHILRALATCGVGVRQELVLSCVSSLVPLTKRPQLVPFAEEILIKGYHVYTFTPADNVRAGEEGGNGDGEHSTNSSSSSVKAHLQHLNSEKGLTTPFVHVYGGTALAARRVAAEAVDTFIHKTTALPEDYKHEHRKRLAQSSTRWLRLAECPYDEACPDARREGPSAPAAGGATSRLERVLKDSYVVSLVDVLERRLHVAYTSPAEAVQALPQLGKHAGAVLHWDAKSTLREIQRARDAVESVAVKQS